MNENYFKKRISAESINYTNKPKYGGSPTGTVALQVGHTDALVPSSVIMALPFN